MLSYSHCPISLQQHHNSFTRSYPFFYLSPIPFPFFFSFLFIQPFIKHHIFSFGILSHSHGNIFLKLPWFLQHYYIWFLLFQNVLQFLHSFFKSSISHILGYNLPSLFNHTLSYFPAHAWVIGNFCHFLSLFFLMFVPLTC